MCFTRLRRFLAISIFHTDWHLCVKLVLHNETILYFPSLYYNHMMSASFQNVVLSNFDFHNLQVLETRSIFRMSFRMQKLSEMDRNIIELLLCHVVFLENDNLYGAARACVVWSNASCNSFTLYCLVWETRSRGPMYVLLEYSQTELIFEKKTAVICLLCCSLTQRTQRIKHENFSI